MKKSVLFPLLTCVFVLILALLNPLEHPHNFLQIVPGSYLFFALISSLIWILVSKGIALWILYKDRDYYE